MVEMTKKITRKMVSLKNECLEAMKEAMIVGSMPNKMGAKTIEIDGCTYSIDIRYCDVYHTVDFNLSINGVFLLSETAKAKEGTAKNEEEAIAFADRNLDVIINCWNAFVAKIAEGL